MKKMRRNLLHFTSISRDERKNFQRNGERERDEGGKRLESEQNKNKSGTKGFDNAIDQMHFSFFSLSGSLSSIFVPSHFLSLMKFERE